MKLTDIDTVFGETLAKLDTTLAAVGLSLPELLGEEIDAYIAEIAALKLEATDDLEVILAETATPARLAASSPPPAPVSGTVKISVRVLARTLVALKARAAECRQPYQKVLNKALNDAAKIWETPAGSTCHV